VIAAVSFSFHRAFPRMDSPAQILYSRLRHMTQPNKPPAVRPGDSVRVLSLASPVEEARLEKGREELVRLGYAPVIDRNAVLAADGFFSGSISGRLAALKEALTESSSRAVFCSRGGYGTTQLLENLSVALAQPKIVLGYSDLTSLQIFLWQKFRWITLYGPMVASGMDKGAGAAKGYDRESLLNALTETKEGWTIGLHGESMAAGAADGVLLGGCLTLIETALGTPWELETKGAILVLEDRAMKPWQVDRAFTHLIQAGKLRSVRGLILGDFPECEAPDGTETVKDVARRVLAPLGVPMVWGAPVGHTMRPMLTLPLGVRARLVADEAGIGGAGKLEIIEPTVS
jgi:muramoyltetrapeptide carboxypeptidase